MSNFEHAPVLTTVRYKDVVEQLYNMRRVQNALSLLLPGDAWSVLGRGVSATHIGVAKHFLLIAKTKGLIAHDRYLNNAS